MFNMYKCAYLNKTNDFNYFVPILSYFLILPFLTIKEGGSGVNELVHSMTTLGQLFNVENTKVNCSELVVMKRLKD